MYDIITNRICRPSSTFSRVQGSFPFSGECGKSAEDYRYLVTQHAKSINANGDKVHALVDANVTVLPVFSRFSEGHITNGDASSVRDVFSQCKGVQQ